MPMSADAAKKAALAILPEGRELMPFTAWIDQCVSQGIEREMLRSWPNWKARGEVVTVLKRENNQTVHLIGRGGE